MKAYILAAGYATRLYPLTADRAKPLLEVGGDAILTHVARRLAQLDEIDEIVVIANARFHAQFVAWAEATSLPVPVRVLDDGSDCEDNRLGAVGDLAFALEQCPPEGQAFVVAAGDAIFDFDLRPLQRDFDERQRTLLVVRDEAHDGGPTRYNEVEVDADLRVIRFREKPEDARSGLAAIALYFFAADVPELVRQYLAEGGNPDAPGHFVAWLVERAPAAAARFESSGRWVDIGTHESLARARELYDQPRQA